jgi:hypothetical protein
MGSSWKAGLCRMIWAASMPVQPGRYTSRREVGREGRQTCEEVRRVVENLDLHPGFAEHATVVFRERTDRHRRIRTLIGESVARPVSSS